MFVPGLEPASSPFHAELPATIHTKIRYLGKVGFLYYYRNQTQTLTPPNPTAGARTLTSIGVVDQNFRWVSFYPLFKTFLLGGVRN